MRLTREKPQVSKFCLVCNFIQNDIVYAAQRVKRFISREHIAYIAKEQYRVPDSAHSRNALALVAECSPDHLLNHCLRTYAFGIAMAHRVKAPFDKEVFFLGAIMHDLGLTEKFDKGKTFEVDGAIAARQFCSEQGLNEDISDLVHEMVALHNSVGIAHKREPEIALVHFGAGADVAGLWIQDIHKKTLAEVLSEYPRLDFAEGMSKLLADQTQRKPHSYMKQMIELGFLDKVRKSNV